MEQKAQQAAIHAKIEKGDYVQIVRGGSGEEYFFYAKVIGFDSDGDYFVVDQDGETDTWVASRTVEKADQEVVEQSFVILPAITKSYNGIIDKQKKLLLVGCQEIPFEKVQHIAALCK